MSDETPELDPTDLVQPKSAPEDRDSAGPFDESETPDGKSKDYYMSIALQNLRHRLSELDHKPVDEWLLISICANAV